MNIEIKTVQTKKELNAFIKLPWKVYKNDPHWVPPLILDMKKILNKKKNPFFNHSDAELFLAQKDGEVVGRVAAIINNNHNNTHNEKTGFFGFFECLNKPEAAKELLNSAEAWVKEKGMTSFRGPTNFSTNDTCGFLTEGFDLSPAIMMTYNPKYYLNFIKESGLNKVKSFYAYYLHHNTPMPERFINFAKKTLQDKSLRFRNINMKDFKNEVEIIQQIYNDAWENNWGFVPMEKAEFTHMAKDLKPVVDPDIIFIAEVDGEPAGFSLALPDYNQILKNINGRLLPFGIFKLLLNKKKITAVRVITLGVRHKFQKKRGLAPAFYYETYMRGINKGYSSGEFSWILEDNVLMNRALEGIGAKVYKKYAMYEKNID